MLRSSGGWLGLQSSPVTVGRRAARPFFELSCFGDVKGGHKGLSRRYSAKSMRFMDYPRRFFFIFIFEVYQLTTIPCISLPLILSSPLLCTTLLPPLCPPPEPQAFFTRLYRRTTVLPTCYSTVLLLYISLIGLEQRASCCLPYSPSKHPGRNWLPSAKLQPPSSSCTSSSSCLVWILTAAQL